MCECGMFVCMHICVYIIYVGMYVYICLCGCGIYVCCMLWEVFSVVYAHFCL